MRDKRRKRIRAVVRGNASRPRVSIYRSLRHLSAQVIDDDKGVTLASGTVTGNSTASAKTLGLELTAALLLKKITRVVYDRGGNRYHGAVKAIADTIREGGIKV